MKILVTGGAGFIGSHLCDALLKQGHAVVCIDDLSLGRIDNIGHLLKNRKFFFIKLNILKRKALDRVFKTHSFDAVFHLAANSDILTGASCPDVDLDKTFLTTYTVLECMKKNKVRSIIFTSSSAIYGELPKKLHENIGPLFPISFYGASKLASEAFISAFCESNGMRAWILRFPNVVGERATHGVIYDFVNQLRKNPKQLYILGNGKQKKPYVYVADIVSGILFAWKNSREKINYFNIGTDSSTTVARIAQIIVEEMHLNNVKLVYSGGDRGWVGDVPQYSYDLSKIQKLGFKANMNSDKAVRKAVQAILLHSGK